MEATATGGTSEVTRTVRRPDRRAKANSPKVGVPFIVISFKAEQLEKAASPTRVNDCGSSICVSEVQAKKACEPMLLTLSGSRMLCNA